MKVLVAHNHYTQKGGEDSVVKTEFELLKNFGCDVRLYERSNKEISSYSLKKKLNLLLSNGWSSDSYKEIRKIIKEFKPDIAHFHNIFFVMTPSVYRACRDEGIAVVQSIHNFRLLCPNALFFRNGMVCEECFNKKDLFVGVRYRCYKNSFFITGCIAEMLRRHWEVGTWQNSIDAYITATEFGKKKYVVSGIPAEKITVKPNIIYPEPQNKNTDKGYALYVGRLSPEKGLRVLLEAFSKIPQLSLRIVGDGPMANELKRYTEVKNMKNVEFLGFVSQESCEKCMQGAKFLAIPSVCYENFPRIMGEAYGYGIPMIASNLGGMPEVIKDRETGLLFNPGDPEDLAEKIVWFIENSREVAQMRENIRNRQKNEYSLRKNYDILMKTYNRAITNAGNKK